jgi:heme exporter protein A
MIQVKGLVKRFGPATVIKDLNIKVNPGEFVILLGPNGAGKTTLLRILASLSKPTSGLVQVASYRLPEQAGSVRRHLGVVSHQPLLYGDLTAEENLSFYARLYGTAPTRIQEVLDLVGLVSRKDDLVRVYSRGMQQRLAIARAVLHQPQILLLDEPYTGLDQEAGEILNSVLKKVAQQGRTVIMTSHDLIRASALATRIDVLSKGQITASTSGKELASSELISFYRKAIQEVEGVI